MANGNTSFARTEHGVPVVANQSARDALIPNPSPDQRIRRKDTGYEERYDQPTGTWRPESKTRTSGPEISMLALGADPTGANDCSGVATAAKALAAGGAGIIDFDPGIYLFSAATDFTGYTMRFAPGAVVKRSAATVFTFGRIVAGSYKIMDDSAGGAGRFVLSYNPGNQTDYFNIRWSGTKGDGIANDTAAFNLGIDLCYGKTGDGNRNGLTFVAKNRPIQIPSGEYLVDYLDVGGTVGLKMTGEGKLTTKITINGSVGGGIIADHASYFKILGALVQPNADRDMSHPLLDIDGVPGNYTGLLGVAYLLPQQTEIGDCYINCSDATGIPVAQIGVSLNRLGGGSAQGDTFHFHGTLFGGAVDSKGVKRSFAGFAIGSPSVVAGNALELTVLGGDFQNFPQWGIFCNGGTVRCIGTGFQNQNASGGLPRYLDINGNFVGTVGGLGDTPAATATQVGLYNQIDMGGGDVFSHWFGGRCVLTHIRTESYVLCRDQGVNAIIDATIAGGGLAPWQAATKYVRGKLFHPANIGVVDNTLYDGRCWMVWSVTAAGGTNSGGAEPSWATAIPGYVEEAVVITAGSSSVPLTNIPARVVDSPAANYWVGVAIDPTGVNPKWFFKITAHAGHLTADSNAPWSSAAAIVRIGPQISDGALQYMPYNYIAVEGELQFIQGLAMDFGQIKPLLNPPQYINGRVSRWDWLWEPPLSIYGAAQMVFFPRDWNVLVTGGLIANNQALTRWSMNDGTAGQRRFRMTGRKSLGAPIMFDMGYFTAEMPECGIGRIDGWFTAPDTDEDLTRNMIAVLGNSIGAPYGGFPDHVAPNFLADTAGSDFNACGGPGIGLGASGSFNIRTAPPGVTGTQINTLRKAVTVDPLGRLQTLFGIIKKSTATTNVANAGTYTPDATAAEIHRLNFQGATGTVANPAAASKVDGARIVLDIKNGSGGASACTLDTDFLGTFTMGANGKRRTQPFIYDGTAAKWVPTGGQSVDL